MEATVLTDTPVYFVLRPLGTTMPVGAFGLKEVKRPYARHHFSKDAQ